jgi:hypothetical protein
MTLREPYGVVGLITPWNFPLRHGRVEARPALITGYSVVPKAAVLRAADVLKMANTPLRRFPAATHQHHQGPATRWRGIVTIGTFQDQLHRATACRQAHHGARAQQVKPWPPSSRPKPPGRFERRGNCQRRETATYARFHSGQNSVPSRFYVKEGTIRRIRSHFVKAAVKSSPAIRPTENHMGPRL